MGICPFADQSHRFDDVFSGGYTGGPFKGVLHTTEGSTLPDYDGGGSAPHFTVLPDPARRTVRCFQHFDTDVPSRALLHNKGDTRTNNDSAVQIELVGTCDRRTPDLGLLWPEAPPWALAGAARLMRWVEQDKGIPRVGVPRRWMAFPESAGLDNRNRLSRAEWDRFAGWCGHMHVPENDHGDPGDLPVDVLLGEHPDVPSAPGGAVFVSVLSPVPQGNRAWCAATAAGDMFPIRGDGAKWASSHKVPVLELDAEMFDDAFSRSEDRRRATARAAQ